MKREVGNRLRGKGELSESSAKETGKFTVSAGCFERKKKNNVFF